MLQHTGDDVTGYFWLALIEVQKTVENAASNGFGAISQERFKRGSRNLTRVSRTIGPTKLPDMTSLAVSGRLQNVIKYGTVVRKTGLVGQRI